MGVDLSERVSCQKSKRMRTSFKHHQLRSMQNFFTHNHNPDAKDLKELAQKTGLTKRVLQVRKTSLNLYVSDMGVDLSERVSCQKSKRMRTSFKHHQLRSMQNFFTHNHNPDAKDLKELAQKTGLTKRVLQVWFQNARAKLRRNCLYQESVGVDNVSDNSTITSPSVPSPQLSHRSLSPSSPTGTSPSQHAQHSHNTNSPMPEFLYHS
ncbi:LIM/homeobox protein Lhx2-like [Sinocyclocheilus grahami]|uniref:LIM/homeobox protein Lhx2-like n=1 Tax=Sinocyclocheilus grahami TaxID=75366 RepID=UPI0007AC745C|nr:PREDICTED: LIM/homeobox protein Lhx2-like [Sinocyclocheilus grahami]